MKTIAFLIGLSLATPAMAQSAGEKTGANSVLGLAPKTADFVAEAAVSDMFEVQSSKIAASKLTGPARAFADQMIVDHTKTSTELTAAAKANNIPIPPDMDKSHKEKIDKLNASTGDDFRKRYFDEQVSAHKDAVSLFNRYKNGGDVPKLREWAATTLPVLQHHLEMAENLDK